MVLNEQDLAMFEAFRVPEALLIENEVRRVSDCEARELFAVNGTWQRSDLAGVCFPYYVGGRRVGARLRRDNPERESGKPRNKYLSEQGRHHLYLLRRTEERLQDPTVMLCFVESEKSVFALTAWAERMCAECPELGNIVFLATGGVWGWRTRVGKVLEPNGKYATETGPVDELAWARGRICYILFDANSRSNADVKRARSRFAATLRNEFSAAEVRKLLLPESPGVNGPDDFLRLNDDRALVDVFNHPEQDRIVVASGESPEMTDTAEEILLGHAQELRIFQRGGEIVRVICLPEAVTSEGLRRPQGAILLDPLTPPALSETLERIITFEKAEEDGFKRTNCPKQLVNYYLSRRGQWRLDVLVGIVMSPILRLDGTVLDRPGYDESSALYLHSDLVVSVPEAPSREEAQEALAVLSRPFAEFPFCSLADHAVAITAIVTAIERRVLDACPLFGYSAPSPRTGKSKLAAAAAIVATGKPAPASAVSPDKEEFRKALFAALREGHAVINLDNIEFPLKSADLCKVLTEAEFSDRVLGESRTVHVPTNALWTATGNNLSLRGDLATRALVCRIDAAVERPEERHFAIEDLQAHLLEHRAEMVGAALTILRAFHVAGRPTQALPKWGGFDGWSRFVREPLVWAGLADPCLTRQSVLDEDPDKEAAGEALRQLRAAFPDTFTVKEVVEKANDQVMTKQWSFPAFHDALAAVSGGGKNVDPQPLGKWMRAWRDRYVDGLRLVRAGMDKHSKMTEWTVKG
jgi:Domain of unknown function (DUF3854)